MKYILASASPRRLELLQRIGISPIEVRPSSGEEKANAELSPGELVTKLARAKAAASRSEKDSPEDVLIAADTVVALDGKILGKPKDEAEAREMLRSLSGRTHEVFTGIALTRGGREECSVSCTRVTFRELSKREIEAYVATGEPLDKAGAYGIQGKGSLFVSGIDGDYFTVVGFPLCLFGQLLGKYGVELF